MLVWKLDRIGRNRTEMAIHRYRLKKNGVKIRSVTENIPETPEGIILESVLEGMAEYYSENLAANVMRGLKGAALQCRHTGGRPLLGYRVNPDKSYSIDEAEAATVRRIFRLYADGAGYSDIIDRMNAEGRQHRCGQTFRQEFAARTVAQRAVCGGVHLQQSTPAGGRCAQRAREERG